MCSPYSAAGAVFSSATDLRFASVRSFFHLANGMAMSSAARTICLVTPHSLEISYMQDIVEKAAVDKITRDISVKKVYRAPVSPAPKSHAFLAMKRPLANAWHSMRTCLQRSHKKHCSNQNIEPYKSMYTYMHRGSSRTPGFWTRGCRTRCVEWHPVILKVSRFFNDGCCV